MLLPTTYGATLLALALAALFWGIWANTQRADRTWRFELYALDFAIGALLTALVLAFTLGNSGSSDTFTFEDNLTVASKRNMATALAGGALYGLGQMMILSGVALAGMSTALPVAAGVGMLVVAGLQVLGGAPSHPMLVLGGALAALAALGTAALAQKAAAAAIPVKKGMHPGWKSYILSSIGGLIVGPALFIVESSRGGDIGLGSYGSVVFMTVGLLLMTPLACIYFLNMPVQGSVLSFLAYRNGSGKQHALGLLGGAIWAAGTEAFYAAAGATMIRPPALLSMLGIAFGGAVAGALCGLLVWGELANAGKARMTMLANLALMAIAATLFYLGG